MKDVYLSIDLDFWMKDYAKGDMFEYLDSVLNRNIPVICVAYHHEMLPYVNSKKGLQELINVDFHSDLTDMKASELEKSKQFNEGTWINFVNFRKKGKFTWIYPNRQCYIDRIHPVDGEFRGYGRCDVDANPFDYRNTQKICEWKQARVRSIMPTKKEMERVVEIGICLSPNWIEHEVLLDSLDYLVDNEIVTKSFRKKCISKADRN